MDQGHGSCIFSITAFYDNDETQAYIWDVLMAIN